jgi:LmbE family N-acetylglucosaminyl deacetylase
MKFLSAGDDVLLLCPHPDDELASGGFIRRAAESNVTVHYVYFSTCAESTRALGFPSEQLIEECHDSCRVLGIRTENIQGFDIPVRHFPQHRQEILETMVRLRKEIKPRLVLCPATYDVHQDHHTISEEAIRAFKFSTILGYEFPWNQLSSRQDVIVGIEPAHLQTKIEAWNCYKTQQSRPYHGEQLLESLARVRGIQGNTEFAESFESIRIVL